MTAPVPIEAPAHLRRQSCNRCYGQKLRCVRENEALQTPCDRCRRLGGECLYGFSRQKGRPSKRSTSSRQARQSTVAKASTALVRRNTTTATPSSNTSTPSSESLDGRSRCPSTPIDDPRDQGIDDLVECGPSIFDSLDFPMADWDECQVQWLFGNIQTSDALNTLSTTCLEGSEPGTGIADDTLFDNFQKHSHFSSEARHAAGRGIIGKECSLSSNGTRSQCDDNVKMHDFSTGSLRDNGLPSPLGSPPEQSNTKDALGTIALLSQINSQLCTLQHTCADLAMPDTESLELIASWFLGADLTSDSRLNTPPDSSGPQTNNLGRVLHESFAVSHRLHNVMNNVDPTALDPFLSAIRQEMILVAHTQLLGVLARTLAVVEQHIDACSSRSSLAETRVVLVVQLCSYIVERQNEAVDLHVSWGPMNQICSPKGSAADLTDLQETRQKANSKISASLAKLRGSLRI